MVLLKVIKYFFHHRHSYDIPVLSRYISFNTRDITYLCKCGEKKIFRIRCLSNQKFPIPTNCK